ncbi:nucleotidyltransferase family protein [Ectothiorhodospira mobilis]|uniref:nucleotidyltransferase domain-containing protein n=1 Tax=Ectothiorhodospira mobilis TaxID=195064 RepID=UPI001EE7D112|nr:nucleotidyltransferase family protein [Ectothiorhodospira mobilis]MCG5534448.1 nucleotidyltransferase family protein [Ectothiorhodospira mobilis]
MVQNLLVQVLLHPQQMEGLGLPDWDRLIRQARVSGLLIRLAVILKEAGLLDRVPPAPRGHLRAALILQTRQRQAVFWEVEHLLSALQARGLRLVLLKGAAYVAAGMTPGRCRLFTDFDLLVPRGELEKAELALMMRGWTSSHRDAYDQRYYRTWMHELPPMRHFRRASVVDVHHNLVPDTAPLKPDPERLLARVRPCPGMPEVFVPDPLDMILHSAVHLFHDGEFDHGLRDLFDIRDLVGECLQTEADWQALVMRSRELDLERPLFYALRYLQRLLEVRIPGSVPPLLDPPAPPRPMWWLLDALFERGLLPDHETCRAPLTGPARFALYVRGHALRMPPHLLLPHLLRKGLRRMRPEPDPRPGALQRAALARGDGGGQ